MSVSGRGGLLLWRSELPIQVPCANGFPHSGAINGGTPIAGWFIHLFFLWPDPNLLRGNSNQLIPYSSSHNFSNFWWPGYTWIFDQQVALPCQPVRFFLLLWNGHKLPSRTKYLWDRRGGSMTPGLVLKNMCRVPQNAIVQIISNHLQDFLWLFPSRIITWCQTAVFDQKWTLPSDSWLTSRSRSMSK